MHTPNTSCFRVLSPFSSLFSFSLFLTVCVFALFMFIIIFSVGKFLYKTRMPTVWKLFSVRKKGTSKWPIYCYFYRSIKIKRTKNETNDHLSYTYTKQERKWTFVEKLLWHSNCHFISACFCVHIRIPIQNSIDCFKHSLLWECTFVIWQSTKKPNFHAFR